MPIVAGDIQIFLSGGAGNSDPNASLGGIISATQLVDNNLHNLFDVVGSAEASAGDTEYRCVYVKNNHGTLTWQNVVAWISTQSTAAIAIALAGEGLNGTAETVADESTAPAGESFTSPTTEGGGLSLGNMAAGDVYPIWIRRTVTAAQSALSNDTAVLSLKGDTAA